MRYLFPLLLAVCLTAEATAQSPLDPIHNSLVATHYSIPVALVQQIRIVASQHSIPDSIAFALIRVESAFNVRARSPVGARGLTQVMPETGRFICGLAPADLWRPILNLNCGFSFLRSIFPMFDEWRHSLIAYHRGPRRTLLEESRGRTHGISSAYAEAVLAYARRHPSRNAASN